MPTCQYCGSSVDDIDEHQDKCDFFNEVLYINDDGKQIINLVQLNKLIQDNIDSAMESFDEKITEMKELLEKKYKQITEKNSSYVTSSILEKKLSELRSEMNSETVTQVENVQSPVTQAMLNHKLSLLEKRISLHRRIL